MRLPVRMAFFGFLTILASSAYADNPSEKPTLRPIRREYSLADWIQRMPGKRSNSENVRIAAKKVFDQMLADNQDFSFKGVEAIETHMESLVLTAPAPVQKRFREALDKFLKEGECQLLVDSHLVEMGVDYYAKVIKPELESLGQSPTRAHALAIPSAMLSKIREKSVGIVDQRVLTNTENRAICIALFRSTPNVFDKGPAKNASVEFEGVEFSIIGTVPRSHELIFLKIKQRSVAMAEAGNGTGRPTLTESVSTTSYRIEDRETIAIPVHYQSAEMKKKGRMWLVLIQPAVFQVPVP